MAIASIVLTTLVGMFTGGLATIALDVAGEPMILSKQVVAGEAIRSSLKANSLRMALSVSGAWVMAWTIGQGLIQWWGSPVGNESISSITAISLAMVWECEQHLGTWIKHRALRYVLDQADIFPWDAVTFLNAMSERLLLECDEAFYRFRHLLLRDFIADLSDDDIARLAREIDGEGVRG